QHVPAPYAAPADGLAGCAADRKARFAGQTLEVERLSGFCLLARRDVLATVGGFDEQFGLGFFDDDDLGLRVERSGYKLVVALDTYVHHYGSRTVLGLAIDSENQLAANLARFRDKWGPERASRYRLDGGLVPPPRRSATRQRVSLCMIVKDEEHNLPD